jgi:hypothetical protein
MAMHSLVDPELDAGGLIQLSGVIYYIEKTCCLSRLTSYSTRLFGLLVCRGGGGLESMADTRRRDRDIRSRIRSRKMAQKTMRGKHPNRGNLAYLLLKSFCRQLKSFL